MRVICEFRRTPSRRCSRSPSAIFGERVAEDIDELTDAMHVVGREARTIEGRLSKEQWIVGAALFRHRHGDFSLDSDVAARLEQQRRRGTWARASCPWSATTRRSPAGFIASSPFRATSAPIRRIGAIFKLEHFIGRQVGWRRPPRSGEPESKQNERANRNGSKIMSNHEVHVKFAGKIVCVGFGSIGQGVLPLILRHIGTSPDRITIVTAEDRGRSRSRAIRRQVRQERR